MTFCIRIVTGISISECLPVNVTCKPSSDYAISRVITIANQSPGLASYAGSSSDSYAIQTPCSSRDFSTKSKFILCWTGTQPFGRRGERPLYRNLIGRGVGQVSSTLTSLDGELDLLWPGVIASGSSFITHPFITHHRILARLVGKLTFSLFSTDFEWLWEK